MMGDPGGGRPPDIQSTNFEEEIMSIDNNNDKLNQKSENKKEKSSFLTIFYKSNSIGPFSVIIEGIEKGHQIGRYNHLKIAQDIFNSNLKDIIDVKVKGKNKLAVNFLSAQVANNFVKENQLNKEKEVYKIYIPRNQVTRKGIARDVNPIFSEIDLMSMCETNYKILEVKRLSRKINKEDGSVDYVSSGTVLFTFEGIILPREIKFCYLVIPIIPYVARVHNVIAAWHMVTPRISVRVK